MIPCEYVDEYHLKVDSHFCRTLYYVYLTCARGVMTELQKLTNVAKTSEKRRYVDSKSFKVVEFGTNRTELYDFILVVDSNLGYTSHAF